MVENTSLPLWKGGRTNLSKDPTFSDFTGVENGLANEKRNDKNMDHRSRDALRKTPCRFIDLSCKREIIEAEECTILWFILTTYHDENGNRN